MSEEHLHRLYDVSAYIRAARAVAREVTENTPLFNRTLSRQDANHLEALSEAVQYLLDRAGELVDELETAMEAAP